MTDPNAVPLDDPCPVCGESIPLRAAAYIGPDGIAVHVRCAVLLADVDERTIGEMKYAIRRHGAGLPCPVRNESFGSCSCGGGKIGDLVYSYFTDDGMRCADCVRKLIAKRPDVPLMVSSEHGGA